MDSVVVTAEGKSGERLGPAIIPVEPTWTGQPNKTVRTRAAWALRMEAEQGQRRSAHDEAMMNGPVGWLMIALGLMLMVTVPGYFILQLELPWRLTGSWRKAAVLPLIPIVPVLVYTIHAFLAGSNLFPVVLILTSPFAMVYLLIVMVLERLNRPSARTDRGPSGLVVSTPVES